MSMVCRSCRARVIFAQASTGRRMILDAHPAANGNVIVDFEPAFGGPLRARVLAPAEVAQAREAGISLHLDHHVTCPQAHQWRRPKTRPRPSPPAA